MDLLVQKLTEKKFLIRKSWFQTKFRIVGSTGYYEIKYDNAFPSGTIVDWIEIPNYWFLFQSKLKFRV